MDDTSHRKGTNMNPPAWPIGEWTAENTLTPEKRKDYIQKFASLPSEVEKLVSGLTDQQVNLKYNKWTIRQIVHHLADSHINCFVRLRLTLTEENPTIKPYDESKWSELIDNTTMAIDVSINLLAASHKRMVVVLENMTPEQFQRTYYHPEYKKTVSLDAMLSMYVHHGRHHAAQIEWVKSNRK